MQGFYHVAGSLGLKLLSKGILEPFSISLLAVFAITYFIVNTSKTRKKEATPWLWSKAVLVIIIENINIFPSFPELGSQIHVVATVFLTVLFWTRFRNSKKYEMQMIDDDIDGDEGAKQ